MGRIYSKLEYVYALHTSSKETLFLGEHDSLSVSDMLDLGTMAKDKEKLNAIVDFISEFEDDYFGLKGRFKTVVQNKDLLIVLNVKFLNLPVAAVRKYLGMTPSSYSVRKRKAIDRYLSDHEFKSRVITIIESLK